MHFTHFDDQLFALFDSLIQKLQDPTLDPTQTPPVYFLKGYTAGLKKHGLDESVIEMAIESLNMDINYSGRDNEKFEVFGEKFADVTAAAYHKCKGLPPHTLKTIFRQLNFSYEV